MSDLGHEETDKALKSLERRISREYKEAYKTANDRLMKFMERFDEQDKEKLAEMAAGKIARSEYIEWRAKKITESVAFRGIKNVLAEDMTNANKIAMGMINDFTKGVYADNVNFGVYEIESGMNMATTFTLYDKYTVENLLKDDPHIIPQARLDIPKDLRWNRKKINSAITQGILAGDSIPNIAKRLQGVTDMNKKAAIRNARTYTTAAENKGRVDSYKYGKSLGIKMKQQWMATVDMRTRASHRALDGQMVEVGGTFANGCKFPGDPDGKPWEIYNCRCTLVGALEGFPRDASDRFTRLPEGMTYDEWKNVTDKSYHKGDFASEVNYILDNARLSSAGITTDDIYKVGKIFSEEVENGYLKPMRENLAKAEEKYERFHDFSRNLENQRNAYREEMWDLQRRIGYGNIGTPEQAKRYADLTRMIAENQKAIDALQARKDFKEARFEYFRAKNAFDDKVAHAKYLRGKIGEVRSVGVAPDIDLNYHLLKSRSPMKKVVMDAYDCYPTAWIRESVAKGKLSPIKVDRGYYNGWQIAISGDYYSGQFETAIHELGHRFEDVKKSSIVAQETEFYKKRTAGESLEWLGRGYGRDEKTRRDQFLHSYMGKDYGGSAYELVSMGFEYAYTDPVQLAKDPDMQQWILGMLLAL